MASPKGMAVTQDARRAGGSERAMAACGPAVDDADSLGMAPTATPFWSLGNFSRLWSSSRTTGRNRSDDVSSERAAFAATSGRTDSTVLGSLEQILVEEHGEEILVPECGITPGMGHRLFVSRKYGVRLQVQQDSVLDEQESGPITVTPLLKETMVFEDEPLEGILEVHCLPTGRQFDAPLLFDFLIDAGTKHDPILDDFGRIRYEVLTKDCGSKEWARDPDSATPLEIVKDDQGRIYVRAQVRHFSWWSFWKKGTLDKGNQGFPRESIPWRDRERHQSLIMNKTPSDVTIHAFAWRMSQWTAAVDSVKAGVGAEGAGANFELGLTLQKQVHAAALLPQMLPISAGRSEWFEIPRVGTGKTSSRKAMVAIATESDDGRGGKTLRLEALLQLRCNKKLTVTLNVDDDGKLKDPPIASCKGKGSSIASDNDGIFSLVMRVIQNQFNPPASGPPPTAVAPMEGRIRSEDNSGASSATTTVVGSAERMSGETSSAFAVTESEGDEKSPHL